MARKMRPQRLTDLVEIQHKVVVSDGMGGEEGTWEVYATRQVGIIRSTSFRYDVQRVIAGGVESLPITQVVMRRDPVTLAITTKMRMRDVTLDQYYAFNTPGLPLDGDERWLSFAATLSQPL